MESVRPTLALFVPLAVTVLSQSACHVISSSESFYGLDVSESNLAFLVDISGSMEGRDEAGAGEAIAIDAARAAGRELDQSVGVSLGRMVGNEVAKSATKLGEVKRELAPVIRGLPSDARFGVVTFGGVVESWSTELLEADGAHKNMAVARVEALSAKGDTPALAALEQAFEWRDLQVIFFVSDGRPTDGRPDVVLEQVGQLNAERSIRIHAVGMGEDQVESFLEALAEENQGVYVRR